MTFTSTIFIFLFLPVTLAGYYLLRSGLRNLFLVIASLAFYSVGDWQMFPLLLISILVNYVLALLQEQQRELAAVRRLFLVLSLVWNFGLLYYYKYFIFSVETVNSLLNLNFVLPIIGLPLGISFYTFRTVSYQLDTYWDTAPVAKNPLDLALYVSFFPQVTMGPITKYSEFAPQIKNREFSWDAFTDGSKLLIAGLFKKLVISNGIAVMVDHVFSMADGERTVVLAWMGILGFLIQLYYDFSGYSDMADGIGRMFGFQTPKNFDYPYMSKSVVEFWNSWHITLGRWLRDYLYTPVFRSLQGKKYFSIAVCNIIALFATWLFAGIWHGAAWHYVAMGLYYFVFIAEERVVADAQKKRRKKLKLKKQSETKMQSAMKHLYFFVVLIFGQLLFRIDSLSRFLPYVGSMFGLTDNAIIDGFTKLSLQDNACLFLIGIFFSFPVLSWYKSHRDIHPVVQKAYLLAQPLIYTFGLLISISYMLLSSYNPFLYLNF